MSYFPGLKLTKAGEQLLAKVSGNLSETISFRKAELGSGTINSDDEIRFLTALKEKWKDVNISDCKIVGDEQTQVQIELQFDNAGINTNKIFRELGIYAAANDGREVLFAYSNAKENFDYIPAATDNPQSFVINILITITSNTKVNAQIDLNSYVTLRKFNEELAKKLDKGAVSSEYDTAKKIEDKIKTAQNTANNKLDKGTVSAEYNTAAKMEAKIKVAQQTATNAGSTANNKLTKGSLPAEITDAKGIYDLIENNSGLNFDPNLLFLNDAGTKTQDKIYFDRNKKGLFRCTQTTTATTNSTTYFEDISNKSSADRLANLDKIKVIEENLNHSTTGIKTLSVPLDCSYKFIRIITHDTVNNGYMQETVITYKRKSFMHMILGLTVTNASERDEVIVFSFPDDNTLRVHELTVSGGSQLTIKGIEQFN